MPARAGTTHVSDAPERCGVYLLTHPRSASNMFQTMMAKQPGYQGSGYKFFDAGFAGLSQMPRGRLSQWPEEDRKALYDIFRAGWESLEAEVADANQNGKQALIKEHAIFLFGPDKLFSAMYDGDDVESLLLEPESAHTNPTSLPDRFLLSMQPIFQIRHPALMFSSMVRTQMSCLKDSNVYHPRVHRTLTLSYSRAVFDWYLENGGERKPRVIDADDIMNDPAAVRQLCVETGLDPDAVQYEWVEQEVKDPIQARFLSTISASKGIIKGMDAQNLDIEAEKVKWRAEFGNEAGEELAKYVHDAMPDYEYLKSQRVRSK